MSEKRPGLVVFLTWLTFLEGLVTTLPGLGWLVLLAVHFGPASLAGSAAESSEGYARAMEAANVAFGCALMGSAALLWRRRRSGIYLLLSTLPAEVLYFVVIGFGLNGRNATAMAGAAAIGNIGLGFQILTAFPLVGAVLGLLSLDAVGKRNHAAPIVVPSAAGNRQPIGRKLRLVLRVLAALTLLEAAASIAQLAYSWALTASHFASRGGIPARTASELWVDAVLFLALVVSATLLWRQNGAGLTALTVTALAEIAALSRFPFLPGPMGTGWMPPGRRPGAFYAPWGQGNLALGVQIVTLFPLIAAVLIILAARYRAILASDADGRAPDGRPALTAWKSR